MDKRKDSTMSRKPLISVKDAFGNDIHPGDQVIWYDKVYCRLSKSHVVHLIHKSRIEVVAADANGNEHLKPPFSWMDRPLRWQIQAKKVMLCPLDQQSPSKGE